MASTSHMAAAPAPEASRTIDRDCPVCGATNSDQLHIHYAPAEWPMKQCASCDTVYLEKAWSLDVLFEQFDWGKSVAAEDARRAAARGLERKLSKRWRRIRNALFKRKNIAQLAGQYASPGAVLDVGAGDGYQLMQLPEGFTPVGIEISTAACQVGEERIKPRGGRMINADALSGLKQCETGAFTAIMMRSFLEHDLTPRETLAEAARALAPGGIVIIKVPNYACWNRHVMGENWCGFRFPEHQNYFTPKTLVALAAACDLHTRRFGFWDKLPISDNMWLIAEKPAG